MVIIKIIIIITMIIINIWYLIFPTRIFKALLQYSQFTDLNLWSIYM